MISILFLLLFSCSDHYMTNPPLDGNAYFQVVEFTPPPSEIDALFVLDTSCSMMATGSSNDLQFWIPQFEASVEQIDDLTYADGVDWRAGVTVADPNHASHLVLDTYLDRYSTSEDILELALGSILPIGYLEAGLGAALQARLSTDPVMNEFWRPDALSLYVIISDEDDQSTLQPEEIVDYLGRVHANYLISVITGDDGLFACQATDSPKYQSVADGHTDICLRDSWYTAVDVLEEAILPNDLIIELEQQPEAATVQVWIGSDELLQGWFYSDLAVTIRHEVLPDHEELIAVSYVPL